MRCKAAGIAWLVARTNGGFRRAFGRNSAAASCALIAALMMNGAHAQAPQGQPSGAPPSASPGVPASSHQFVRVSDFQIVYEPVADGQLPTEEILARTTVPLVRTVDGWVGPDGTGTPMGVRLQNLSQETEQRFAPSALRAVVTEIVNVLSRSGLIAVKARIDSNDVTTTADNRGFDDLRTDGRSSLRIIIITGTVKETRTLASGDRIQLSNRLNHKVHNPIRQNSPVQPGDVIRKDWLDNYIFWLSRHPGRRVDIAIDSAAEPGQLTLDYLVAESKPWLLFAQVSNTGTEATNEWRERFGFINNQLTNNDDILNFQYITAGFDQSHAFSGYYEAPLSGCERLRWRAYANWSEYDASEVGQFDEEFHGEDWSVGGQVAWNFFQRRDLFLDLFAGARWQNISVSSSASEEQEDDFFIPTVGITLEQFTDTTTTTGLLALEFNVADVADTDDPILGLGRTDVDTDWVSLMFSANHSFFIDPLLHGSKWKDESSEFATLAHELSFSLDGQYAFGNRLVPQFEHTMGGFFTVRGYPESATAGDTVVIGRAEYLFHWPRTFGRTEKLTNMFGQNFHHAPSRPYGRADWDLIFRAFFDAGWAMNSDRIENIEEDEVLLGTGVGVEFQFKQNITARMDWGVALRDMDGATVDAGSNRFHFMFTILY